MIIERILFSPIFSSPVISSIVIIVIFFVMLSATWKMRLRYVRYLFLTKQNRWVLLEIKLPPEIRRSPEAMEQFLINGIWWSKGGGTNAYKKYWQGEVLLNFSLEIVSIGGNLQFFIHTPAHLRDMIQAQLYAQYPQVEIKEAIDYVDRIPFSINSGDSPRGMFSWEYTLDKEDALPIKTYRQYGFDKAVESLDADQQVDPLIPLIEKMSSIDPWEEIWIQIIVRAHKDDAWRKEGRKLIDDFIEAKRGVSTEEEGGSMSVFLTQGEKDYITAIENNIDQFAFEVGIRSIYLTHDVGMFKVSRVSYLKDIFSSFSTQSLNGFKFANPTGYDNPWEDYDDYLENNLKDRALERYRARAFFGVEPITIKPVDYFLRLIGNYKPVKCILTSEELATIFHLPGGVYQSPSLERTETKKAQPPTNLPVA